MQPKPDTFYTVRNRNEPMQFTSDDGWTSFKRSTLFSFSTEVAFDAFMRDLPDNCELVEVVFEPVIAPVLN